MIAKYAHCPKCGGLSRFFLSDGQEVTICPQPSCGTLFSPNELVEPECSDEWIPSVLGQEISIVQKKDLHGRISMGWFSASKVLIAEARAPGREEISPVFDQLVLLAVGEARRRNQLQTK